MKLDFLKLASHRSSMLTAADDLTPTPSFDLCLEKKELSSASDHLEQVICLPPPPIRREKAIRVQKHCVSAFLG